MSNLADIAEASLQITCPSCLTAKRVPIGGAEARRKCSWCGATPPAETPAVLDETTFGSFVSQNDRPALVFFWAPWCSPSRAPRPWFRHTATALHSRVRSAEVDIDKSPMLADRLGIYTFPTLVLFKDGREVERISGTVDFEDLERWMSVHS